MLKITQFKDVFFGPNCIPKTKPKVSGPLTKQKVCKVLTGPKTKQKVLPLTSWLPVLLSCFPFLPTLDLVMEAVFSQFYGDFWGLPTL